MAHIGQAPQLSKEYLKTNHYFGFSTLPTSIVARVATPHFLRTVALELSVHQTKFQQVLCRRKTSSFTLSANKRFFFYFRLG